MTESKLFTPEHIELALAIISTVLLPLGSGIIYLIGKVIKVAKMLARIELKVDTMWAWYTNHGSNITGYREGDEYRKT